MRMQTRFLGRRLVLVCRGDLVRIGIGRMMTEMLGGATGFMLAISRDRAPAELECQNRKHDKDEASGNHAQKYSMGAISRCHLHTRAMQPLSAPHSYGACPPSTCSGSLGDAYLHRFVASIALFLRLWRI